MSFGLLVKTLLAIDTDNSNELDEVIDLKEFVSLSEEEQGAYIDWASEITGEPHDIISDYLSEKTGKALSEGGRCSC